MDLREWIANDHAFVLARFSSAIVAHIPAEHWKANPGSDNAGTERPGSREGTASVDAPSIAWLLFHTTYHQDLALNTAIRNHEPLLAGHRDRLGLGHVPPEAGLTEAEDRQVTDALDLSQLDDYVRAVNARTAEWIDNLSTMALDSIPSSSYRLEHKAGIPADGELSWLHAMWHGKAVSWLVQWECIGHGHAHVGEMVGIRNRLGFSPF